MKLSKKITSIILAILVLFSTFSFSVEKHYCGDFLVDVAYFGNADSCGMKMNNKQSKKKGCCKDEVAQIKGQKELQKQAFETLNFEQQKFIVAHVFYTFNRFKKTQQKSVFYKDFSPPDLEKDFQILYETFLI